ncbi:hypothetical protein [Sphingomonas sp. SUN039]|uniref:hypothetical protein n=1 Tax=Sphingomonas sp. SUN039 TaxID=2937787 RepID=UPI0021648834|nr:hypothetical protein [Sphingomonas sp. SUN039]UVO52583.1 hypothetical protein M0209_00005 [Sphingomonas sp. SUN039]
MTLEDINYIAQTIAAFAVVGSLIYLAIQTRQAREQTRLNTEALKASAGFEATHSWATLLEAGINLPKARIALVMEANAGKTWDEFSDLDRFWLAILHRALFQKLEGQYFLLKYGSLDPAFWEKRRDWAAGLINLPFFSQWWAFEKAQHVWTDEFIAAIEAARDTSMIVPWHSSVHAGRDAPPSPAQAPGEVSAT